MAAAVAPSINSVPGSGSMSGLIIFRVVVLPRLEPPTRTAHPHRPLARGDTERHAPQGHRAAKGVFQLVDFDRGWAQCRPRLPAWRPGGTN